MLGFRDLVLIPPTPSLNQQDQLISAEHHSNLPLPSSAALSVGLGIFPLLTATPCEPQPQSNEVQACGNTNNNLDYWSLKMCPELNSAEKGMINVEGESSNQQLMESDENGIFRRDFTVCQDCGNRAKKDCIFRRCRTCCKGRGYDCNTHVKRTWVPAARRRERQMTVLTCGGAALGASSGSPSGAKRPRALGSSQNAPTPSHSSTSNAGMPRSSDTSSCHQDASFKQSLQGQVRAPAVFRCHRAFAIGNGEDEFAYLATVHISGHVFKGFLYDQGVNGKNTIPCVSELQLGNVSSGKNRACFPNGVPTNAYPASCS